MPEETIETKEAPIEGAEGGKPGILESFIEAIKSGEIDPNEALDAIEAAIGEGGEETKPTEGEERAEAEKAFGLSFVR